MRVVKNSVPVIAAMLLSGVAIAAASTNNGIPASVAHPVPVQADTSASRKVSAPAPTKPVVSTQSVAQSAAQPAPSQPAQVYADTPPAQASGAQPVPADVNINVPYASVLPKDAEIVPGAPGKNEFFIVAAEDAAKIKQLVDHTKPGREIVASDIKSKQPIVKVKLDESNATLVSMDVLSSVKAVAKEAVKPSVQMTANDEVMSIYTKERITPIGSRAVAVAGVPKLKVEPDVIEQRPMMKLLAADEARVSVSSDKTVATGNPLTTTATIKSTGKVVMPDKVAVKETIQQPVEQPVALPVVSKEAAPTLEMVMQQASKHSDKVVNKTANAIKTVVRETDAKAKKLAEKKASSGLAKKSASVAVAKSAVTKSGSSKKTVVAGKVIPYEHVKLGSKGLAWSARHALATADANKAVEKKAASTKLASKKDSSKNVAVTKHPLNVGVVHSYAEYLSETGHKTRQNMD